MQIKDKKAIEQELGKFGLWSGKLVKPILMQVKYLGGIPEFDELIQEGKLDISTASKISFDVRPNGLELNIISGFSTLRIGLVSEQINYWAFEPQEKLLKKKSKSIVGRALIGGVLLGPVGAIVGGMTGIGDKETSKSTKGIDNILSISYTEEDDEEYMLVFDCSDKKAKKVLDFFNSNFPDKYEEELEDELDEVENENLNVADELMKLKSLLDEGLLTREEFDNQKSKLLGN